MSTLITICARVGSKGLPGKHMRMFNRKPLIQWTIEQAMECGIGDVAVCTDDEEIIKRYFVNANINANFLLRPHNLSQDDTPKLDVLRWCLSHGPIGVDTLIDLDATNPCRTVEHILEAKWKFDKEKPNVLFSVTHAKKNPQFNQVEICNEHPFVYDGGGVTSRQEAVELFDMNSSIYVYNTKWLEDPKNVHPVCFNSRAYIMPKSSFCDIDCEADFVAAEALHRRFYVDPPVS
jgi:CMP-N,N'-diacetyllegionaminic acid synthase